MRINAKVRYAIRMMADIARYGSGEPVALKDVAERQGLSRLYLSQLTASLKNAALLKSVWVTRRLYTQPAGIGDPPSGRIRGGRWAFCHFRLRCRPGIL